MQMFFFCGISTLFWGLMYGSFFGNLFTSVAETFFGRKVILRPLWIDPTGEPLTLLIFSIALGFIQIITGLCLKLYSQLRIGIVKEGLLDTVPWIVALSGLGLTAAGLSISQLQKPGRPFGLPGFLSTVSMINCHLSGCCGDKFVGPPDRQRPQGAVASPWGRCAAQRIRIARLPGASAPLQLAGKNL